MEGKREVVTSFWRCRKKGSKLELGEAGQTGEVGGTRVRLGGLADRLPPTLARAGPVVRFPATPLALSVSSAPLDCVWTLEGATPVSF